MSCKNCKYTFHKLISYTSSSEIGTLITLVRNEDYKAVARIRISEVEKAISIDFIVSFEQRKGYGSRLVRLIQAMARKRGKSIHADVVYDAVDFFKKQGFTLDNPDEPIDELNLMTWRP